MYSLRINTGIPTHTDLVEYIQEDNRIMEGIVHMEEETGERNVEMYVVHVIIFVIVDMCTIDIYYYSRYIYSI